MKIYSTYLYSFVLAVIACTATCYSQDFVRGVFYFKDGTNKTGIVLANHPNKFAVIRDSLNNELIIWYDEVASCDVISPSIDNKLLDESCFRSANAYSYAIVMEYDSLDHIYLKNGITKTGVIIDDSHADFVILLMPNGREWKYYYANIDSIAGEPMPAGMKFLKIPHGYPGAAAALSLFIPGGGQLANGDYSMALVFGCGTIFSVVMLAYPFNESASSHQGLDKIAMGMLLISGIQLVSMIEAVVTASARESARKEWLYKSEQLPASESGLQYDFGIAPLPQGAAVGLNIRF